MLKKSILLIGIVMCVFNAYTQSVVDSNQSESNEINTVTGLIKSSELGFTLTHEHIMSNFKKEISETYYYDSLKLLNQVIPYLEKLRALGVTSIFDCTTEYFGRRVDLLKVISEASGIQIITNTGIYGAANDLHVPEFAYHASIDSLSKV